MSNNLDFWHCDFDQVPLELNLPWLGLDKLRNLWRYDEFQARQLMQCVENGMVRISSSEKPVLTSLAHAHAHQQVSYQGHIREREYSRAIFRTERIKDETMLLRYRFPCFFYLWLQGPFQKAEC